VPNPAFTPNLNLVLLATGTRGWGDVVNTTWTALDALAPLGALAVAAADVDPVLGTSTSLHIKVAAGTFRKSDGTSVTFAGSASTAVPASTISAVYLDDSGNLNVNPAGFPAATSLVRLATVNAGPSALVRITDQRAPFTSFGATIANASPATAAVNAVYAGPVSGAAAAPTFRPLVAADVPDLSATYCTLTGSPTLAGAWTFSQPINGSVTGTAATITGTITEGQVLNLLADLTGRQPHSTTLDALAAAIYPTGALLAGQGTGVPTTITLGSGLSLASGVLSATGGGGTIPGVMVGSGPGHASGLVPDPGATAGTSRFLCENGTWANPSTTGGGGGLSPSDVLRAATPPAVTGSRQGNAALGSLLRSLTSLGLLVDHSTD
jgi:hypothetical protein